MSNRFDKSGSGPDLTTSKVCEKIKRTTLQNLELSGIVEDIGVEPTTSCMPCKRSSQLS